MNVHLLPFESAIANFIYSEWYLNWYQKKVPYQHKSEMSIHRPTGFKNGAICTKN